MYRQLILNPNMSRIGSGPVPALCDPVSDPVSAPIPVCVSDLVSASVSVSEYFATAFEMFFVQGEDAYIKEISPELFIKLRQISTQGEEDEEV